MRITPKLLVHSLLVIPASAATAAGAIATESPALYGPVPNEAQLKWSELEMYAFVHFTVNTFTDREWGFGDEDPALFNPTDFSADQIVGTLAEAGFKGVILTAKHHDGFCLWPTKTTPHNITQSPWENGQGDMVREFELAARGHQVKFGVYLSPWDRNTAIYGKPEYIQMYREQLRELLTNYGPIFETWHDNANGGDGYYGGDRGKREINAENYYDWPGTWKIVKQLQPDAVIWAEPGEVRWVGNEKGFANYPCWATITPTPGNGQSAHEILKMENAGTGMPDGTRWSPAEVNTSIRPGWFYHASEDRRVRSPKNLLKLYFDSVGRGGSLLLNVPPDRRGRIADVDVQSLKGFKKALDEMYAVNFAQGATVSADSVRGPEFAPENVLKKGRESYWATPDNVKTASLTLDLNKPATFNTIRLAEAIQLGQRVRKFSVDVRENGAWVSWIQDGFSIGMHTLLRDRIVTTDGVRLRIIESAASPCLSEVSLLLAPDFSDSSAAQADPNALSKTGWKVKTSQATAQHPAALVIDGNPATYWSTDASGAGQAPPQWVEIDLGSEQLIAAVTVMPRQNTTDAVVDRYLLEWSSDGENWFGKKSGEFSNIRANPIEQRINLPAETKARHIRFTAASVLDKHYVSIAEIGVIKTLPHPSQ